MALLAGGLLLTAHYTLRQDKSVAQPKAEPTIREQKLPSGTICRVALYGSFSTAGRAEKLERLEVSVSGNPVYVPPEAFFDLTNINVQQGVEFGESAGDTFLLLAGGENGMDWQAKFTVRNFHLAERELKYTGQSPLLAEYAPPGQFHEGVIPPAELERYRKTQEPEGSHK